MSVIPQGVGNKQKDYRRINVDIPAPSLVDIQFDINLTVSEGLRSKKRIPILKNVAGHFKSGQLTAIMGPSGAGKSSLLNALTGFSTQGVTGTIRAGGSLCEFKKSSNDLQHLREYRKMSCYILQDDRLNPLFTVAELMKFAADLKLGFMITDEVKHIVIMEIINTLGLVGTESTRCCNLSGGQRKRLSIAVELIDNPPVIFLDEPTTGLDSLTSLQCIEMLKNLAQDGRTIVCTIHQPSASIYSMFDQVYILAEGMCIYRGTSENTVPYLAAKGFMCPKYHNPADYMLEIASNEYGKFNELLAKTCSSRDWTETPSAAIIKQQAARGNMALMINPPHELYKFSILLKRCIMQHYRDWTMTYLKIFLHLLIGILLGLLYYQFGNDGSKSVNNMGYMLVSATYLCYTSLMPAVLRFPNELPVLKKENFNNWYNLKTYYFAVLVTGIPLQICFSFVYAAPSYFLSGQPLEWSRYGMFVLALSNITLLADAFGNIVGTLFNATNGTFIGAIATSAMLVFTGFLILFSHMNVVMRAISYLSFLRHGFEGLVLSLYSFGREPLDCPDKATYCHYRYPKEILKEFGLKPDNYWIDILVLSSELVIVRILAYISLRQVVKSSS